MYVHFRVNFRMHGETQKRVNTLSVEQFIDYLMVSGGGVIEEVKRNLGTTVTILSKLVQLLADKGLLTPEEFKKILPDDDTEIVAINNQPEWKVPNNDA